MKVPFACIGLLVVLVIASGCVPIPTGAMPPLVAESRGGIVPTATPTTPVSPLPTPTSPVSPLPTPTSPVSPLPTPTSPVSPLPTPTSPVSPLPTPALAPAGQGAQPSPTYTEYVVRRGDTLAKIAAKFGVRISVLRAANPSVTRVDRIYVGQHLRIPTK